MKGYFFFVLVLLLLVACGEEPTPTPDAAATRIAMEKMANATLTAETPPPTTTPGPTDTPVPTATPTDTTMPTNTPTSTPTPTKTLTATLPPTATRTPSPVPTTAPTSTPTIAASAAPSLTPTSQESDTSYAALLEQVKQADPNVDFTALRMAYTKTEDYDPYNFKAAEQKQEMFAALDNGDYDTALELANQILEQNYLSANAHFVALHVHEALNQSQEADFHRYVIDGLITSILESGDGKSTETAYVVISIEEEYMILGVLGISFTSQSLVGEAGHSFDVLEGVHEATNTPVTVYFNIDLIQWWLVNRMSP